MKLVSDLPNKTSMYRTAAHHPRVPAIWVNLLANRKGRRLKTAAIFSALYSSNWSASSRDASAMYPEYCENVSGCVTPFSHGSTLSAWHLTWKLFLLRELDRANLCAKFVGEARTTEFFMLIRECCFRSWIADVATIAWIVAIVSHQRLGATEIERPFLNSTESQSEEERQIQQSSDGEWKYLILTALTSPQYSINEITPDCEPTSWMTENFGGFLLKSSNLNCRTQLLAHTPIHLRLMHTSDKNSSRPGHKIWFQIHEWHEDIAGGVVEELGFWH